MACYCLRVGTPAGAESIFVNFYVRFFVSFFAFFLLLDKGLVVTA